MSRTRNLIMCLLCISFVCVSIKLHSQSYKDETQKMNTNLLNLSSKVNSSQDEKVYYGIYKFNLVTLKGDTIHCKRSTKMPLTESIKQLLVEERNNAYVYKPEHTKEIYVEKSNRIFRGIPHNDCWIFDVFSSGELTLFSLFPEKDIYYASMYRLNDGTIKSINKEFVEKLIAGNIKAEKALEKNDMKKALEIYIKDKKKK